MRGILFGALLEACADFAMVPLLTEGGVRHRARQKGRQPGAVRDTPLSGRGVRARVEVPRG